jgi:hypothetical protein
MRINYSKPKKIDLTILAKECPSPVDSVYEPYAPFSIENLQLYNPLYNKFFDMNAKNFDNIALNHPYHVQDTTHVIDYNTDEIIEKPVFIKFSPILDPYRYMIGKYNVNESRIRTLPRLDSTEETVHPKILSQYNASYVDCFFSYLSSIMLNHHGIVHGVDFYGSYLGLQKQFRVCVTDDVEYLRNSDFFNNHVGKLFYIEDPERVLDSSTGGKLDHIGGSRRNKTKLVMDQTDEITLDFEDLTSDNIEPVLDQVVPDMLDEPVYMKSPKSSGSLTSESSADSDLNYSSDENSEKGSDWETDTEEEEEEEDDDDDDECSESQEEEIYGYIHRFPVQMICMEKCDGTLDELFVQDKITVKNGASALFQIIMTLLIYQRAFKFTHNDLHTNNVMYVNTDTEYLFYKFAGKTYKVPTYGRIYKLIDFGRGIYKFQDRSFCSDSFAPSGDAATQYNCEPFLNENRPRLDPNNSFDLCRLGTSIFDFLMEIEDVDAEELDDLQKTIHRWCLDDNGKNVLYKKNGDERYPSFKLYKMIARTVHQHTPEAQLDEAYFKQFQMAKADVKDVTNLMDLDGLPCYV